MRIARHPAVRPPFSGAAATGARGGLPAGPTVASGGEYYARGRPAPVDRSLSTPIRTFRWIAGLGDAELLERGGRIDVTA